MSLLARLRSTTVANGMYGVVDYLSQPLAMLCSAPYLLHHLGAAQYGLWVLAAGAVLGGAQVSAGFGDAAVKYIAACRAHGDKPGAEKVLRTLLGINLAFGVIVAALLWVGTPLLVSRVSHLDEGLRRSYGEALHIGCLLLVIKSVESVFICTQRAYERYKASGQISICVRIATVLAAVLTTAYGRGVVVIMMVTLAVSVVGLLLQAFGVWRDMTPRSLLPEIDPSTARELFGFGLYSWLMALVGMCSGQVDKLIVGYFLGAREVAFYSICVQAATPIHSTVASGMHVLFPYLGARLTTTDVKTLRQKLVRVFAMNVGLVCVLAAPFVLCGHLLLRLWQGADFAGHASTALVLLVCGFAMVGWNITGHYALMAMGRMRLLTWTNTAATVAMLGTMVVLTPRFGLTGAAAARLVYGPVTWWIYRSLIRELRSPNTAGTGVQIWRACENG